MRDVDLREDAEEYIQAALVELRGRAQPGDMAALHELLLDARDATEEGQLRAIRQQAENLRKFCESRLMSTTVMPAMRRR